MADVGVTAGCALVAAPGLLDPNFRRTVVLIVEHNAGGSLGVVLNRPSDVPVDRVLPSWSSHVPGSLYLGGPVEQSAALCLAALSAGVDVTTVDGMVSVHGPLVLVDLDGDPEVVGALVRGLRMFAGYSGWGAGQLEAEIGRGDWVVVPALADDLLAPPDIDLWGRVLRRQGMPIALLATYPADPKHN